MRNLFDSSPSYFGAANSYYGFKSNFKAIFSPEKYTRIYVIKGGPGTGKSTLMKKLGSSMVNKGIDLKKIYCSSDPDSLDGIILEHNSCKVAMVDGTAPHVVEAEYPGCVEYIVNLFDSLNFDSLNESRKDIFNLTKQKKKMYNEAYKALSICGDIYRIITHKNQNSKIYSEAESICKQIMEHEFFDGKHCACDEDYFLSAFCKNGYVWLDIPCIEKEYISLIGDGFTEGIVLNILAKKLMKENTAEIISRSPLTENNIDTIITGSCIISADSVGSVVFDTTPIKSCFEEDYSELYDLHNRFLSIAKKKFEMASEAHFALENIYSSSVNFEYHDRIYTKLKTELCDLLL